MENKIILPSHIKFQTILQSGINHENPHYKIEGFLFNGYKQVLYYDHSGVFGVQASQFLRCQHVDLDINNFSHPCEIIKTEKNKLLPGDWIYIQFSKEIDIDPYSIFLVLKNNKMMSIGEVASTICVNEINLSFIEEGVFPGASFYIIKPLPYAKK